MENNTANKNGKTYKKYFKIIVTAILVLSVGLMCSFATGCDDEEKPHQCESKCVVCDGCTNAACDDPACAEKCAGHENAPPEAPIEQEFECPVCGGCIGIDCSETHVKCGEGKTAYAYQTKNAEVVQGAGTKQWNYKTDAGRTFIENLNQNPGATVTFNVNATEAVTVSLVVTITRRDTATKFTDKMGVSVNDGMDLERPVIIPAYEPAELQWRVASFKDFNLGCIDLQAGTNTIRFTVLTSGVLSSYNFEKIQLLSDEGKLIAEPGDIIGGEDQEPFEYDSSTDTIYEAEDATLVNGINEKKPIKVSAPNDQGRVVVERMDTNIGASVTFTVNTENAKTVKLAVTVNRRNTATLYTDLMGVSVNGGKYLKSKQVIPAYDGTAGEWREDSYRDFYIADIQLNAGVNTISFTVRESANINLSSYNFDRMILRDVAEALHDCESKCSVCGDCLNAACEESVCVKKCECIETVFEAEDADIVNGINEARPVREATKDGRTFLERMDSNKDAKVTFTVVSPEVVTVALSITITRRNIDTVYTDLMGVSVNNGDYLQSDLVIPEYADQWGSTSFMDFEVAVIELKAGSNTISFTVLTDGNGTNYSSYNFDKIMLRGSVRLNSPHKCESVCPVCGNCLDKDCEEAVCAEKCSCPGAMRILEAEDAVIVNGINTAKPVRTVTKGDRTFVERLNTNKDASLTFSVEMEEAATVKLIVTINRRAVDTVFTDLMGISVNGGENKTSATVIPAYSDGSEWEDASFMDFEICDISLTAGVNTIRFTVLTDDQNYSSYNFDRIILQ